MQNNLNRWYDPNVGRWLSEDPSGFTARDTNTYRYVGNEPTARIDPSGLDSITSISPGARAEHEIVIIIGHHVTDAEAAKYPNLRQVTKQLYRIKAATGDPLPQDAFIAVISCNGPSAKYYVDTLFPGQVAEE